MVKWETKRRGKQDGEWKIIGPAPIRYITAAPPLFKTRLYRIPDPLLVLHTNAYQHQPSERTYAPHECPGTSTRTSTS
jgi:hypothetical protein